MKNDIRISLIVLGILELLLPATFFFLILPELYKLNKELDTNAFNPYLAFGFFGFVITLSFIQIIRGAFFKNADPNKSKKLIIVGGLFGFLTILGIITLIINPIYRLLEVI